ncbi:hypothetical protein ACVTMO_16735 [Pseudomonas segetis]
MSFYRFLFVWAVSTFFGLLHQKKYCREWDESLGVLLEKHWDTAQVGEHTAKIGSVEVWVSNKFYSFGHIYRTSVPERRPGIWNMYRLAVLVDSQQSVNYAKQMEEVRRG